MAATPPSVRGSTGIGPLKLDAIRLSFGIPDNGPTTIFVKTGEAMPSFKAGIRYSGGGTLVGRWEWVSPADAAIDETSLLPESQMSPTERSHLRRLERLDNFSVLLPPRLGSYTLMGPSLRAETLTLVGAYRIVLRIADVSSSGVTVNQTRLAVAPLILHLLGAPAVPGQ